MSTYCPLPRPRWLSKDKELRPFDIILQSLTLSKVGISKALHAGADLAFKLKMVSQGLSDANPVEFRAAHSWL